MGSLTTDNQKACRTAVLAVKATKEKLQEKERALKEEKAERQKAVEAERRNARERSQRTSLQVVDLQDKTVRPKKELAAMTANRNRCRAAYETFRTQAFKARKAMEAGERAQQGAKRQLDVLMKAVGELQVKMSRMKEMGTWDPMKGIESRSVSCKD